MPSGFDRSAERTGNIVEILLLFCDLDSCSAVESNEFFTHVNEVAVVDGCIELSCGNT